MNKNVTYFDSFGGEHIPKEIRNIIENKNIQTNIIRIHAYNSAVCAYFCIVFIGFMFAGKILTYFTNHLSPND